MDTRPYLIVSDIHLGAVPAATERAFRDFLAKATPGTSGLLINGDLFDFWFEYRTVIPRIHYRVLAALADVVDAGVPVSFVGGNHDAWGGAFLRDEVGVTLLNGPVEMELAGRRVLVAHGDGVGSGDLGYRMLKRLIRHPVTVGAFRVLHPDWGSWIANRVSSTEHKAEISDAASAGRASYIRRWAVEQLQSDPRIDLVVAGHSHVPVVEEILPGRHYANSGDWIHHRSYLELSPGEPPALRNWSGT
jgi:UDP-2,3-diacylglucosamine hydrolase